MKKEFDYLSLGERIRKIRKQRNMTQEQLAEKCDLSTAHIGHIERGTRALSIESLVVISSVLDVSTDYLLLDISNSNYMDDISKLFNIAKITDKNKSDIIYKMTKILIENIDKL